MNESEKTLKDGAHYLSLIEVIDTTFHCWWCNRINGASVTLACQDPGISVHLLMKMDEVYKRLMEEVA